MTVPIPVFHRTATPTRDAAPLAGVDAEFMAFLAARRERERERKQ